MIGSRQPSWWERNLPPVPPQYPHLPRRVDVLVVGAGFMGRWLAYFLGRPSGGGTPSPHVLVVERDRFGYGASSRNAGFLTCGHISEMLADIEAVGESAVVDSFLRRRRGMSVVRRELPGLEIDECGSVDHDPLTDEGRRLAARLNAAAGEEVFSVCRAGLGGEPDEEGRPALRNALDGGVHPVRLLRRLAKRAAARFAFGVEARSVGRGVAHLETTGGVREVRYGHAFLCTNAFTAALHRGSEVRPGRGQVIVTTPVRRAGPRRRTLGYLDRGYDYFRWLEDRLLVGGGRQRFADHENDTTELTPTPALREYLLEVARRVVGHGDFAVEAHWAGIMGFPRGHHIGAAPRQPVDGVTEAVAGFGGMGVALTPAVAEEIAREFRA